MSKHAILKFQKCSKKYFSDFIIILNGIAKAPILNLSIPQNQWRKYPARIALRVLYHQFLRRLAKSISINLRILACYTKNLILSRNMRNYSQ
jgi:hypothetical protein